MADHGVTTTLDVHPDTQVTMLSPITALADSVAITYAPMIIIVTKSEHLG